MFYVVEGPVGENAKILTKANILSFKNYLTGKFSLSFLHAGQVF